MTPSSKSSPFAGSALLMAVALAGCAAPPAAPPSPSSTAMQNTPAPAARPAPSRPAPAVAAAPAQSSLDKLESILKRMVGESDVSISRTPTGALMLRATGDAAFASGKANLSPRFNEFLQQLANGLVTYSSLTAKVSGHTDSAGDDQLNAKLSEARAQATVNRLVALGVPSGHLLSEGKGEREPIASNDTADGREANRRVDILILDSR